MFDPVRSAPSFASASSSAPASEPLPRDGNPVLERLAEASAAQRPRLARDIVDHLDDAQLDALAGQQAGPRALDALDAALADAPPALDVTAQRARIAGVRRDDDPSDTTTGAGGTTQTTVHVGANTVTWTNDRQGRPVRAVADLSEVFAEIDRSPAETDAQGDAADRGIAGDQGGHLIGHRFVKDQGLKNLFPQNGNFNVSAYKTLENEWADWIDSGRDVHITVDLTPRNRDRPDTVRVSYEVTDPADGRVVYDQRVTFRNEAGQHYQRVPRADMANR